MFECHSLQHTTWNRGRLASLKQLICTFESLAPTRSQFLVIDEATGESKALRPLGEVEYVLSPRELPELMTLEARLDSSLRGALAALHAPGNKCAGHSFCAFHMCLVVFPYRRATANRENGYSCPSS